MPLQIKRFLSPIKKVLYGLAALFAVYMLVLAVAVVWAFEVKLRRWPLFVHAAPFVIRVGDEIERIRPAERLDRLGYEKTNAPNPAVGQWTWDGSTIRVCFRHSPLADRGVLSGPVRILIGEGKVRSIELERALQPSDRLILEPELLEILPPPGYVRELCRPIPLESINPLLKDAIVLTEDSRFFSHIGIDPISIHRALWANIKAGRYAEGGSTIPQQLMKMALLYPEKTLWRKVNDAFLAVAADALYSKDIILNAYLNRIYFGNWGAFAVKGVGEAAQAFFGKDQSELDPAQCALLAAMIRAPNVINPRAHPERALKRRNAILGLLLKAGKISQESYEQASKTPVVMLRPAVKPVRATAFIGLVRDEMERSGIGTTAGPGKQDVITTLDPVRQQLALDLLRGPGDSPVDAHLILLDPTSGRIVIYIQPISDQWAGETTEPDCLLPLLALPGLSPEQKDAVKFTLASPVPVIGSPGRTIPFRKAFRDRPADLMHALIRSVGTRKIADMLQEFGVTAHPAENAEIAIDPIAPLSVAAAYGRVAAMGNSGTPNTGATSFDTSRTPAPGRMSLSADPAVIYLVDSLMKTPAAPARKNKTNSAHQKEPAVFTAVDRDGTWGVVYRSNALVLCRVKGRTFDRKKMEGLLQSVLSAAVAETPASADPPEKVVKRNVCLESGLRSTSVCPHVAKEPFIKGTQPTEWCPMRHDTGIGRTEKSR
ncbi:MAG: transglycosylase domain-containing protein [Pseudomonadota bacterium]